MIPEWNSVGRYCAHLRDICSRILKGTITMPDKYL